jgi:hypothetical protein
MINISVKSAPPTVSTEAADADAPDPSDPAELPEPVEEPPPRY